MNPWRVHHFGHSYIFWSIAIKKFSPVANFGDHPLYGLQKCLKMCLHNTWMPPYIDKDFVEDQMVPKLENDPQNDLKFRCLLHVREFVLGRPIMYVLITCFHESWFFLFAIVFFFFWEKNCHCDTNDSYIGIL